jgi:(2Fe-2S) ferredoxin
MTLPVLKWSKDGAHYDKSMVMPAVANAIIQHGVSQGEA